MGCILVVAAVAEGAAGGAGGRRGAAGAPVPDARKAGARKAAARKANPRAGRGAVRRARHWRLRRWRPGQRCPDASGRRAPRRRRRLDAQHAVRVAETCKQTARPFSFSDQSPPFFSKSLRILSNLPVRKSSRKKCVLTEAHVQYRGHNQYSQLGCN